MPDAHQVFTAIRKSKKLKQKDFVGIASRATIGRFEQGEGDLPTQVLVRALEKMDTTLGEFVTRMETEEMHGYHTKSVNILKLGRHRKRAARLTRFDLLSQWR